MLPQRIVRASALRSNLVAAQRLPVVQRRCFMPPEVTPNPRKLDEKFPQVQPLTEAEDPEMVGLAR